jgi:MFS family permease
MKDHGFSSKTYGWVIAINGVMIVFIQPFAARITGGRPRSIMLALATLLVGVGFGAFGLFTSVWGYIVGVMIFTLGEILQAGISPSIASDLAPVRLRGTYQGVYQMSWALASLVGPWGGGVLMDAYGAPALWATCLAVGVASAGGHLLIAGSRRKRLVELRAAALPVSAVED